jgi:hypothetical protein
MDPGKMIVISVAAIVVLAPVLAITSRIALKPIVDAIVRLRESAHGGALNGAVERRVLELEDEVSQLRAGMARLEETVAFQQKLLAAPGSPAALSASVDA